MVENRLPITYTEFIEKLKKIITTILETGDWEHSIFLKASASKLQKLYDEAQELLSLSEKKANTKNDPGNILSSNRRIVPKGYTQVFVLLYQVNTSDLVGWYRNITTLTEYGVARSVYKDEKFVQDMIRSKADIDRNGYVVVNVKENDFYNTDPASVDVLGNQLFTLKEKTIKLENIVEFIHANKDYYIIHDDKLFKL